MKLLEIIKATKRYELLKKKEELYRKINEISESLNQLSNEILDINNSISKLEEEIERISQFDRAIVESFNNYTLKTLEEKFGRFYYERVRLSRFKEDLYRIDNDDRAFLVLIKRDINDSIGFLVPLPSISITSEYFYIFEDLFNLPRSNDRAKIVELIMPCEVSFIEDKIINILQKGHILYIGDYKSNLERSNFIISGKLREKENLKRLLEEKKEQLEKVKEKEEILRGELFSVDIEIDKFNRYRRKLIISVILVILILSLLILSSKIVCRV